MKCDLCKVGKETHELHEVKVWDMMFWVCEECKQQIDEGRVRP